MQERVILSDRGILVSTTRFVTPRATYAMAQISSVRTAADPLVPTWAWLVGLLALCFLGCGGLLTFGGRLQGLLLVGGGLVGLVLAWASRFARRFYVVVVTSAGEVPALVDGNWPWIAHVCHAVNTAIISRG